MSIEVRDLHIDDGTHTIVHDVSFTVDDGQRVGLIGPSGSGKSMIARAIMGLLPPQMHVSGSIRIDGTSTIGLSDSDMARLRGSAVGMVFQNPASSLNPLLTAAQQIALPLKLHYDLAQDDIERRVEQMAHNVGLAAQRLRQHPHQLSGGQQQRVGIATALIAHPRNIIADEPTTALDSLTQRQIIDVFTSVVDDAGAACVFITHDFSVLARVTTNCIVLSDGTIVEQGSTQNILHHPQHEVTHMLVQAAQSLTLHTGAQQ